jgi:hypothetical protein
VDGGCSAQTARRRKVDFGGFTEGFSELADSKVSRRRVQRSAEANRWLEYEDRQGWSLRVFECWHPKWQRNVWQRNGGRAEDGFRSAFLHCSANHSSAIRMRVGNGRRLCAKPWLVACDRGFEWTDVAARFCFPGACLASFNSGMALNESLLAGAVNIFEIKTRAAGPAGRLPLTEEMLRESPSGDLFGLTQDAGMGWNPDEIGRTPFLILSTQGGLRAPDGKPIALGYHTGHWEISLLVQAAAEELRRLGCVPFAGYVVSGRKLPFWQWRGISGMVESL